MKFDELVKKTANLPCFTIGFLSAGQNPAQVRLQVSRWVKDGKIIRIYKGLYVLAEPYRKSGLEKFCIANVLRTPSYISLQSALAYYGIIPEYVPQITSVTTGRPQMIQSPLGWFDFRHINKKLFHGYKKVKLAQEQNAFIAQPEKALLDLIYLTPAGEKKDFIEQLRLGNLDRLDKKILRDAAETSGYSKLMCAYEHIEKIIDRGEGVEL